jgi:hypothetical protein
MTPPLSAKEKLAAFLEETKVKLLDKEDSMKESLNRSILESETLYRLNLKIDNLNEFIAENDGAA